jgi:hypothetical protein
MGLDLYAGALARYYTGQWETEAQQAGREAGVPVEIFYAGGGPRRLSRLTAPWRVSTWRRGIRTKYAKVIKEDLNWSEDLSAPYFARKPDHAGRLALKLACAYAEHREFAMPEQLPEDVDADPAYKAASDKYFASAISVLECHMFLPSAENFVVSEPDPVGNKRFITSIANLSWALDVVIGAHWQTDPSKIDEWARDAPLGRKKLLRTDNGEFEVIEEQDFQPESLLSFAHFGFAVYSKALAFSRDHNVPILTDE